MEKRMKLMVMGHARHGKDTVCEILTEKYGFKFASSSAVAAEKLIYPVTKGVNGYKTLEECFNDRHNHRMLWHLLIKAYNHDDKARLGKLIFAENDIYCGIRDREEFLACQSAGLFDYSIWVDRSDKVPPESNESCSVDSSLCDIVLDNNGDMELLNFNLHRLMKVLSNHFGSKNRYGWLVKHEQG